MTSRLNLLNSVHSAGQHFAIIFFAIVLTIVTKIHLKQQAKLATIPVQRS